MQPFLLWWSIKNYSCSRAGSIWCSCVKSARVWNYKSKRVFAIWRRSRMRDPQEGLLPSTVCGLSVSMGLDAGGAIPALLCLAWKSQMQDPHWSFNLHWSGGSAVEREKPKETRLFSSASLSCFPRKHFFMWNFVCQCTRCEVFFKKNEEASF